MTMDKKQHINFIIIRLEKIFLDVFAVLFATLIATFLFADYSIWQSLDAFLGWSIYHLAVTVLTCFFLRLYAVCYSHFRITDILRVLGACLILLVFEVLFSYLTNSCQNIAFNMVYWMVLGLGLVFARSLKRLFLALKAMLTVHKESERVIIVGAGSTGRALVHEYRADKEKRLNFICFVDDDPYKQKMLIDNLRVAGTIDELPQIVEKYQADIVIVAIPSAPASVRSNIFTKCAQVNCKVHTVPSYEQLLTGKVNVTKIREIDVADLLEREQIKINIEEIIGYIENKVVLVTGGGGSIGSELCRQIAAHHPRKLIILDIYENSTYEIQQDLLRKDKHLDMLVLIASVRDQGKIENVFEKYRPNVVFNAAAHKHVPLMETSPNEAVKNNVFGTLNVAKCADKFGVELFVQISTDKAVNPTNIMGATKRICEMIVQTIGRKSTTRFVAVRFGNVLGSNGSVVPLFRKQIAAGGPVTVTDKDMIRYFMTIEEAVALVLQAGAYAKGGQIFVLDMGEPVRIYDMACNLVRLSGYQPHIDMDIICTGLRPGEKLYEERLMAEEGLEQTPNKLISIGKPLEIDEENLWTTLESLRKWAYAEHDNMKEEVQKLVPTYHIDYSTDA